MMQKGKGYPSHVKDTDKDCGCSKRQDTLNRLFPYNN